MPVYYTDNYISLVPGETKIVTIEAALADLKGEKPSVVIDGWNVAVASSSTSGAITALNIEAQVDHWPVTGLPIVQSSYLFVGDPSDHFKIRCGGSETDGYDADRNYVGGTPGQAKDHFVDVSALNAGPAALYQNERWGDCVYSFPMKPLAGAHAYIVRLHFAETTFEVAGRRVFNVLINGKLVLSDFDVFQEAGGKNKAMVKEFLGIMPDAEGKVLIQFKSGSADKPMINAIEVTS